MKKQYVVHDIRMKLLTTSTNSTVQVGKPDASPPNLVTSFFIENQGRNSVIRIAGAEGDPYLELRPGDPVFTVGAEYESVLRTTLTVTFVTENQQQFPAGGAQPALDPASTDPTDPAAIIHKGILVETFINDVQCLI